LYFLVSFFPISKSLVWFLVTPSFLPSKKIQYISFKINLDLFFEVIPKWSLWDFIIYDHLTSWYFNPKPLFCNLFYSSNVLGFTHVNRIWNTK
jgi:hypothetical protein